MLDAINKTHEEKIQALNDTLKIAENSLATFENKMNPKKMKVTEFPLFRLFFGDWEMFKFLIVNRFGFANQTEV